MDNNVVKFDFVKKTLMENAVAKKSPSLIRKAIDFSMSVLAKVTFKVELKEVITSRIIITPKFLKRDDYEGIVYTLEIQRKPNSYSPDLMWYKLEEAEEAAKALAVEYVLEIEAKKNQHDQRNKP